MASITIKCSPVLKDRTVERDNSEDEGWEAVLFEQRLNKASNDSSESKIEEDDVPQKCVELFKVIEKQDWAELLKRVGTNPELTSIALSGGATAFSSDAGNLILHELCRNDPPGEVVAQVIAANDVAARTRGNWGYLPIHFATSSGASADVVRILLETHLDSVRTMDCNDHMLPLHLACKWGASEDVLMLLLTGYPEAILVQDDFGRTPLDYARSIGDSDVRASTIKCLDMAEWLCATSKSSKLRAEKQFEIRVKQIQDAHDKRIFGLKFEHREERACLKDTMAGHVKQKKELEEQRKGLEANIVTLNEAMAAQAEENKANIAAEKKVTASVEEALKGKEGELAEVNKKLDEERAINADLQNQIEERLGDFNLALDEIERLNQRLERMDILMLSIRHLCDTEQPHFTPSTTETPAEGREGAPAEEGSVSKARDIRSKALRLAKEARNRKAAVESKNDSELVVSTPSKDTPVVPEAEATDPANTNETPVAEQAEGTTENLAQTAE